MFDMTTTTAIGRLRTLKTAVLADGKVDWDETDELLRAIRPLAVRRGFIFEDYERLLMKCRTDGKITPEESRELAIQLEFLCSLHAYKRLVFWLSVALAVLIVVCSLALFHGVVSSTDTRALREPTAETERADPTS